MKFARWFSFRGCAPRTPIANETDTLLVEPNALGGWGLRFEGEPVSARVGNYATAEDAARIARDNCTHVRVLSLSNHQLQPA